MNKRGSTVSVIQSLEFSKIDKDDKELIHEDIIVLEKLAQIRAIDEETGDILLPLEIAQKAISTLITVDLQLPIDAYIQVNLTAFGGINLDLNLTQYTETQQANIYYLFYVTNLAIGNYNLGRIAIGEENYEFDGLGIFWPKIENSYVSLAMPNTPIESRYIFPTALHLLATAYLDFNHYNNYAAAQTKRFQIRELC